jgi:transposase
VQRAKIILLISSGQSQWAVSRQLGCSINTVRLLLKRFMEERLAGLFSRHRGKVARLQRALFPSKRHKQPVPRENHPPAELIRPQSYQRGLWILPIPLFQWSLKGSKLISIHLHLLVAATDR